jgi:hypothetical protein
MSLTQVFTTPVWRRHFFEAVIRDNLDLGRPDRVSLLFPTRLRRNTPPPELGYKTRVITYGVAPSLHVKFRHSPSSSTSKIMPSDGLCRTPGRPKSSRWVHLSIITASPGTQGRDRTAGTCRVRCLSGRCVNGTIGSPGGFRDTARQAVGEPAVAAGDPVVGHCADRSPPEPLRGDKRCAKATERVVDPVARGGVFEHYPVGRLDREPAEARASEVDCFSEPSMVNHVLFIAFAWQFSRGA